MMLERLTTQYTGNKRAINPISAGRLPHFVFLIFSSNKEKRCFWVSLVNIHHDMKQCKENSTRLECACTQTEFVLTEHVGLVKEFQTTAVFNVLLDTNNICMVGLGRLKAILKGILQEFVLHTFVVHLEDKRISVGHAHAALHDLLVNWIPKAFQFFIGHLYSTWRGIVVIYRKAQLAIRHADCGYTAIENSPLAGLYFCLRST